MVWEVVFGVVVIVKYENNEIVVDIVRFFVF